MMVERVIFVGGIHGAGKTEVCKQVAQHLTLDHVTASDLIRQAGVVASNEKKQVDKIPEKQDLLITGLKNYKPGSKTILLDGHFCLLDQQANIIPIPMVTFEQINPTAVVVKT